MHEPLDLAYLTAHARQQQDAAFTRDRQHADRCVTACGHRWHGLPCTTPDCMCPSSFREPT